MASPDMYARLGAVGELRSRLVSDNLPVAVAAYDALADSPVPTSGMSPNPRRRR